MSNNDMMQDALHFLFVTGLRVFLIGTFPNVFCVYLFYYVFKVNYASI